MNEVLVTTSWDDGHKLDIKLADLLKKYGIKGTFYISPKDREIDFEKRLTDSEILELSKDFEIGAHTMTHPKLTKISLSSSKKEILDSKKYLENLIGRDIKSFCYPGGYYKPSHSSIVKDMGFYLARNVKRFSSDKSDDFFNMKTTIHAYRHLSDIFSILKEVGFRKFFKSYLNWDILAMNIFDNTIKKGGVFHLWGHSWEIEKNNDWKRLENVLKYISNRSDVKYIVNSELV